MKVTDFASLVPAVNGKRLSGFADADDAILLERLEDSFKYKVGADGRAAVFRSSNRSGRVTLKLQADSEANTYLMAIMALEEGGPGTFVPIIFTMADPSLADIGEGSFGVIIKPANMQKGNDNQETEWQIFVENMNLAFGGATVPGF